jgi:hypothetical protein
MHGALSKDYAVELLVSSCVAFNPEGEIEKLTIAAVDLHPLTNEIRSAAQTGALQRN